LSISRLLLFTVLDQLQNQRQLMLFLASGISACLHAEACTYPAVGTSP
jgi:hypothetical protein